MKDALVIVNPASAGGRTGRTWHGLAAILRGAGVSFDSALTTAPGEATVLAREAIAEGWPLIIAAGGDGTVHEVVNGFFDERGEPAARGTRFGVFPLGTGGDFRRTFDLPTDPTAAAAMLHAGRRRRIDVGRVTFERDDGSPGSAVFCNVADAGLGGEVAHRVNHGFKIGGGGMTFALAGGASLLTYRNRRLRVDADGETLELMAQQAVVANARYYGGGMHIAPHAEPDDGLLDLVLVGDLPRTRALGFFRALRGGRLSGGRYPVETRRVRRVRVESETLTRLDVDGEQPGRLPATFEVVPGALELIVP